MKTACYSIGLAALCAVSVAAGAPAEGAPDTSTVHGVLIDGLAAYVNDHVITIGDVLRFMQPMHRQLAAKYRQEELREKLQQAYDDALNTLIERYLILDAYEARSAKLPEWLVDNRINEIIVDKFEGDREKFMSFLAEDRMTYKEWREEVREHLIVQYMRRANVEERVRISPAEVRELYERNREEYQIPAKVKVRMIVLKKNGNERIDGPTREEAASIRKKLVDRDEDFAVLAKRMSEGSNAERGGDWGWIEPRILRSELAAVARELGPGEISPVIETENEFYILTVEGRRNAVVTPFEEIEPQIERELRAAQASVLHDQWIARLRDTSYVKIVEGSPF